MLAGRDSDAQVLFDQLREIADMRGVLYMPASELTGMPVTDLVQRVEKAEAKVEIDAVLGAAPVPKLYLSQLFEVFEDLTADQRTNRNEDQLRRWRAPRQKAIANLISVVGDVPVQDLRRDHGLQFRKWWWQRVQVGMVTANSANKDLTYLSGMVRDVASLKGWTDAKPFLGLRLKETENRRPPFFRDWIRGTLLKPGALGGLNDQARDALLALVNTGARPSEIVDLRDSHIHLNANIPHIAITADDRDLKTKHSARLVPLVGVSFEALRRQPLGFERFRGRATSLSNLLNKYLRTNKMLQTPKHSICSLRHALNEALIDADCPDRIRHDVMGHRGRTGVIYGQGADLETRLRWLKKVSYP